ncbi:YifB family Mg chelatase-like AAA ATPase [Corynebacterium halotolerans]|uniref:AAA+ ATPase domain-containing protein n=1 Tax=Corynebacterium halotolerans YIM 70093 = DSM 44683 TaxID=1121362 RepID=M1NN29_9CORY|nr:YifB family Mg chelatase-like AAA ATPase [Corynebacterium halotolerans]AGF72778.1 hypothetical protein A605_08880 [Corynebacterium halotolerans YIM 70093 = DSM 44683]
MALGRAHTTALSGVTARPVTIEANIGPGLPGIHVVGLGDTAVSESRDRIRTAVANAQLEWPKTKIVVSLSPASLPKAGSHFDLPMALAVLAARQPEVGQRLSSTLVLGELGLDGSVRPVPGILPALLTARAEGYRCAVIPPGNAAEATLIDDLEVLVAGSLADAWEWGTGESDLPGAADIVQDAPAALRRRPDFADLAGQEDARFAAEVAAAGGHHMLMIGPPGSGKSMIAARLPGLLPPLSTDQAVEATAVHSVAGPNGMPGGVVRHAPFVAPHHSVTRAALLGGGAGVPRPGAVSLAHHGVLFLDEASEIPAATLDGLRTPLEDGQVRLVRARREVIFPARIQLVLAANPCRCAAEEPSACRCTVRQRTTYLNNLSGPLRDRLDIGVRTSARNAVLGTAGAESTAVIAERVAAARQRAAHRWWGHGFPAATNAAMDPHQLRRHHPADEAAMALLGAYLADGVLSQRGVDRALKLAWTICDLAGGTRPDLAHVARAIDLRGSTTLREAA